MKGTAILLGMVILGMITLLPGQPTKARSSTNQEWLYQNESDPTSIINNLEVLNRNFTDLVLKPGWLHYTYEIENNTDEPDNGKLDNGQIIPLNYILDEWYLLDGNRNVLQAVTYMLSTEGQVLQSTIFKEGRWRNLTLGEEFTPGPFTPDLYFDFLDNVKRFYKIDSALLNQSVMDYRGKDVLQFSVIEKFKAPLKLESLNQAVIGGEVRAFIDPNTGEIYQVETILETIDGTKRTTLQTTVLALEYGKELDPVILALLDN